MKRMSIGLLALLTVNFVCAVAQDEPERGASRRVLEEIMGSSSAAPDKVRRMSQLITRPEDIPLVLSYVAQVDKEAEKRIASSIFENKEAPKLQRFFAGEHLVKRLQAFRQFTEFKRFVVDGVVNGGEDEFKQFHDKRITFIGEFCAMVCQTAGYDNVEIKELDDDRVPSILINCLAMGKLSAEDIEAEEKEAENPTGEVKKNLYLSLVPLALAKLQCTEAIDKLKEGLKGRNDRDFRVNCAYALGILHEPNAERLELDRYLLMKEKDWWVRYRYGEALLERGDIGSAINFFRIKNLGEDFKLTEYHLDRRLDAIERVRHRNVALFYNDLFSNKDFIQMIMHKPEEKRHRLQQRLRCYQRILTHIKANRMTNFNPTLLKIAMNSKIKEVQRMSYAHLNMEMPR